MSIYWLSHHLHVCIPVPGLGGDANPLVVSADRGIGGQVLKEEQSKSCDGALPQLLMWTCAYEPVSSTASWTAFCPVEAHQKVPAMINSGVDLHTF